MDAIATKPKPQTTDDVVISGPLLEAVLAVIVWRCGGHKYSEDDERKDVVALVGELRAYLKKETDQ
jgi:hypothetical protein